MSVYFQFAVIQGRNTRNTLHSSSKKFFHVGDAKPQNAASPSPWEAPRLKAHLKMLGSIELSRLQHVDHSQVHYIPDSWGMVIPPS